MASSNKLYFHGTYQPQQWSLPDTVIYCFTKYPTTAKGYQKLIQTCKYFFAKNPIFIVEVLSFNWICPGKVNLSEVIKNNDYMNVSTKFWITDEFDNHVSYGLNPNDPVSSIIPKLYQVDVKYLFIYYQSLSLKDFLFFASKALEIVLNKTYIKKENGSFATVEEIVKILPSVKKVVFYHVSSCITSNTVKKLLQIPHFLQLDEFQMNNIPECFDIKTFFTYIKTNTHTKFSLWFGVQFFVPYKNLLDSVVNEILATENHKYKIPWIKYFGLPRTKEVKLHSLCRHQKR